MLRTLRAPEEDFLDVAAVKAWATTLLAHLA